MTKQERLAGLKKAIQSLKDWNEDFSCNAVQHKVNIDEGRWYAKAMKPKNSMYSKLHVRDILAVAPYDKDGSQFGKAMDFRVWLVSMYYGYVASGAEEGAD